MKYNKLVRDKIPEIIKGNGQVCAMHTAEDTEYWKKLKEKLLEEVQEFLEDENEEELADVLEVLDAIILHKNFNKEEILKLQKSKADKRGGFKKKIILEES